MNEKHSAALRSIYDASTSRAKWTHALDELGHINGAKGVTIFTRESTGIDFYLAAASSIYRQNPDKIAEYLEKHRSYDAYSTDFVFRKPEYELVEDEEIWPGFLSMKDRPDLAFLLGHFGVFRRAAFNVANTPSWRAIVALHFAEDMNDPLPLRTSAGTHLLPHITKALEISRFCGQLENRFQAVLTTLDHVDVALCLCRPTGEIVVKNARAEELFFQENGIAESAEGYLQGLDENDTTELQKHIFRSGTTAEGKMSEAERSLCIPKRDASTPFLVQVSPLRDGNDDLNERFAGALVMIVDPNNPPKLSSPTIAKAFGLSGAETSVMEHLTKGLDLRAIADNRKVSLETIRKQSKSIYAKLGARGRVDMIRKVAVLSPPLLM